MHDVVLNVEFCKRAYAKACVNPDLLDADEARYIIYFTHRDIKNSKSLNDCVPEGTILRSTCGDSSCVNPDHVVLISPPKKH